MENYEKLILAKTLLSLYNDYSWQWTLAVAVGLYSQRWYQTKFYLIVLAALSPENLLGRGPIFLWREGQICV